MNEERKTPTAFTRISFQNFTRLPVVEVVKSEKAHNEIMVSTPHKGPVIIPLIEGWLFKTEKDASGVIKQIQQLENEAKEYLLEKWLNPS
jgi:hypothetical protein